MGKRAQQEERNTKAILAQRAEIARQKLAREAELARQEELAREAAKSRTELNDTVSGGGAPSRDPLVTTKEELIAPEIDDSEEYMPLDPSAPETSSEVSTASGIMGFIQAAFDMINFLPQLISAVSNVFNFVTSLFSFGGSDDNGLETVDPASNLDQNPVTADGLEQTPVAAETPVSSTSSTNNVVEEDTLSLNGS